MSRVWYSAGGTAAVLLTTQRTQVIAIFDSLYMRLLGIAMASFSTGEYMLYAEYSMMLRQDSTNC